MMVLEGNDGGQVTILQHRRQKQIDGALLGLTCVNGNKGVIKVIFILFSRRLRRTAPVLERGVSYVMEGCE